jgi:hypothetical protein
MSNLLVRILGSWRTKYTFTRHIACLAFGLVCRVYHRMSQPSTSILSFVAWCQTSTRTD